MKVYLGYKQESDIFFKFKETREDYENWYKGDVLSNKFEIYMDFNPTTLGVYPTIDIKDSKGRVITNIMHDGIIVPVAKEGAGNYYVATYTLGKHQILSTGRHDITVCMNKQGTYKKSVCNSAVEILGTDAVSGDILIVSKDNASNIVQSMLTIIKNMQDQLGPLDTAQADNAARLTDVESKNTSQDERLTVLEDGNIQIKRYTIRIPSLNTVILMLREITASGGLKRGYFYSFEDYGTTEASFKQYLFIRMSDNVGFLLAKDDSAESFQIYHITKPSNSSDWTLPSDSFTKNSVLTEAIKNFAYNATMDTEYGDGGVDIKLEYSTNSGKKSSTAHVNMAMPSWAGVMSARDKRKLDGIEAGATRYTDDMAVSATKQIVKTEAETAVREYTYSKSTLDNKLATLQFTKLIKVNSLPTENINTNAVYLVKKQQETLGDVYTEYIYTDEGWEVLGDTSVNLDNYVSVDSLLEQLSDYATKQEVKTAKYEAIGVAYDDVMSALSSANGYTLKEAFIQAHSATNNMLLTESNWVNNPDYVAPNFVALFELVFSIPTTYDRFFYKGTKLETQYDYADIGFGMRVRYMKHRGSFQFGINGTADNSGKVTINDNSAWDWLTNEREADGKIYINVSLYQRFNYLVNNLNAGTNTYAPNVWTDRIFGFINKEWNENLLHQNAARYQAYVVAHKLEEPTSTTLSCQDQICTPSVDHNISHSEQDVVLNKLSGRTRVSRNLLNIADKSSTTTNGITYSVKNGVITLNGTSTSGFVLLFFNNFLSKGTYFYNDFTSKFGFNVEFYANNSYDSEVGSLNYEHYKSVTLNNDCNYIMLWITNNVTFNNDQIKPMLVRGTEAPTTFEPYFEGFHFTTPTQIESVGGNLFDESSYGLGNIAEENGIGNVSGYYYYTMFCQPNTQYSSSIAKHFYFYDKYLNYIGKTNIVNSFITPNNCFYLRVENNGLLTHFMLNKGTTALPYAPYQSTTQPFTDLVNKAEELFEPNILAYGINGDYNCIEFKGGKTWFNGKYALVNMDSLKWQYYSDVSLYTSDDLVNIKSVNSNVIANALATNYPIQTNDDIGSKNGLAVYNKQLVVHSNTRPTGYLIYELAQPIVEDLGEYPHTLHLFDNGSFILNDEGSIDFTIALNTIQMVIQNGERDIDQENRIRKLEERVEQPAERHFLTEEDVEVIQFSELSIDTDYRLIDLTQDRYIGKTIIIDDIQSDEGLAFKYNKYSMFVPAIVQANNDSFEHLYYFYRDTEYNLTRVIFNNLDSSNNAAVVHVSENMITVSFTYRY